MINSSKYYSQGWHFSEDTSTKSMSAVYDRNHQFVPLEARSAQKTTHIFCHQPLFTDLMSFPDLYFSTKTYLYPEQSINTQELLLLCTECARKFHCQTLEYKKICYYASASVEMVEVSMPNQVTFADCMNWMSEIQKEDGVLLFDSKDAIFNEKKREIKMVRHRTTQV